MTFTIKQNELKYIADIIGGVIPKKNIKPILSGVKIYNRKDRIIFEASDMESAVRIVSEAYDVKESGQYVVDAETLKEIAKNSIANQIEFDLQNNKAVAKFGTGLIKIPVMNAEDYPELNFAETGEEIKITADMFHDMTDKTVFSASNDEMQRNLNGVLWEFEGQTFKMVTADSYRMAVAQRLLDRGEQINMNMFVPLKAIRQMQKLIKSDTVIRYDSKSITFAQHRITFSTRLMDVQFPNYKAVLPSAFQTEITVNRKELIDAVKLIAVIAKSKGDTVKFDIQGDVLSVTARSQDRGDGDVKLMIEKLGKDMLIAFDPHYLIEGLSKYDVEEITLRFVDENNAMQTGDEHDLHIIMPVKIRS